MTGALATHYANALADTVFGPNAGISPQDAAAQLAGAENLISSSKEIQLALLSPAVRKGLKVAFMSKLAEDLELHRLIRNFLLVVTTHHRVHQLKGIREQFELAVDERLGWVRAEISSARDLTPEQREHIERALGTKLGKFIRAEYKVDPAVLGGVRARVASREYDATLAGQLTAMHQQLIANA